MQKDRESKKLTNKRMNNEINGHHLSRVAFITEIMELQVILHTFMDSLRDENGRSVREINKHGAIRSIENQNEDLFQRRTNKMPTYEDMTQRNERKLVSARKTFYEKGQFRVDYLTIGMFAGHLYHFGH